MVISLEALLHVARNKPVPAVAGKKSIDRGLTEPEGNN